MCTGKCLRLLQKSTYSKRSMYCISVELQTQKYHGISWQETLLTCCISQLRSLGTIIMGKGPWNKPDTKRYRGQLFKLSPLTNIGLSDLWTMCTFRLYAGVKVPMETKFRFCGF